MRSGEGGGGRGVALLIPNLRRCMQVSRQLYFTAAFTPWYHGIGDWVGLDDPERKRNV